MRRQAVFLTLLAVALVQLAVPLQMIRKRQQTLEHGTRVRFRTAPVDPYDAFRGRYVALAMADSAVTTNRPEQYPVGRRIFVLLETDAQGFARPTAIARRRPGDELYVEARVALAPRAHRQVPIAYPFDRYYMNEELAPAAERAYLERTGERDAFVTVRIRSGFAVLEELYVDGVPIGEYLSR